MNRRSSYTLTASFSGRHARQRHRSARTARSSTFTVNPDTSTLTYTGPTTAVNGQPVTLSGTLTTDTPTPGTPLPTKVVTFTIGSGSTRSPAATRPTPAGTSSCTIATVNQPISDPAVTASFTGDVYDTRRSTTSPMTVTEPTTLTVNSATGDYADATTVSGTLTDTVTNVPIPVSR